MKHSRQAQCYPPTRTHPHSLRRSTPLPYQPPSIHYILVTSDSRPNLDNIRTLETQFYLLSSMAPSSISSSSYVSSLTKSGNDLERTRLNGMFGHLVNPLITTRSSMGIEPVRLHISLHALRRGLVEIATEHDDPTGIWIEDGGIVSFFDHLLQLTSHIPDSFQQNDSQDLQRPCSPQFSRCVERR